MNKVFNILFLITAALLIKCGTDRVEPDPERVGYNFYPLAVGNYWIYNVDETEYKFAGGIVGKNYQLKVEIVDSLPNQTDGYSYIMHRSKRMSELAPWEFLSAWPARKNTSQAILTEENTPYIKISFPVADGKTWDGNALNSMEVDEYTIDSLNNQYISPLKDTISNTLTVIQEDNKDFTVELDRRYEVYARDTGLVYKEDILFQYCTDPECIGQQEIEMGHEYRQYLIEYGKN